MSKYYDAQETLLDIAITQLANALQKDPAVVDDMISLGWSAAVQATLPTERARKLYREATALAEALHSGSKTPSHEEQ